MKKSFLLICAALTIALSAHAIRPIHKLFPVKQSDGTTVMLYKNGDGHLAFYTTEDHQVVVRNGEGTLCYAQLDGNKLVASSVVCHNIDERTADEQAFLASNTLKPTDDVCTQLMAPIAAPFKAAPAKAGNASTTDGLGKLGTRSGGRVPSIGNVTIPVIMVQFSDTKFQERSTTDLLTRFFNEEGYNEDNTLQHGSVKDYFKAQSRGMFNPTFDVVAMVTLDNGYAYYGKNNTGGGDSNAYLMVKEAVAAAKEQGVDFTKYVSSITGNVPNVIIYYAGEGEATGGDENTVWPHELDIPQYWQTMSGTRFGSYYVGNELYFNSQPMGMGVFVHEFSHAMGLPDFYVTNYAYSNDDPFGMWSVMDGGSYDNSAYAPMGYNAYERSFMGWLDIKELSDAATVTLTDPNLTEGQMAVMFRNPSNSNEYFILENRQPGTWYNSKYGSGLMLTHFTYNASAWTSNTLNNTQAKKRAHIVTANDATLNGNANEDNLFGNGVNCITTQTLYDGSTLGDHEIYKVFKQADGSITFAYKDRSQYVEPQLDSEEYELITDLSQLQAQDTIIFVCAKDEVALALNGGEVQPINIKVSGTKAYSTANTFKGQVLYASKTDKWAFRDVNTKKYLAVNRKGVGTQTSTNTYAQASVAIADGKATLTFGGSSLTNNMLDYDYDLAAFSAFASAPGELQLYRKVSSTPTGIAAVRTNATMAKQNVYNLNGQFVGTTLDGLAKGIYIQGGKKVVVK